MHDFFFKMLIRPRRIYTELLPSRGKILRFLGQKQEYFFIFLYLRVPPWAGAAVKRKIFRCSFKRAQNQANWIKSRISISIFRFLKSNIYVT